MALLPGARIGPYEVLSAVGAGGMGEVYRARDTRLGRDVALKVLPDALAGDADRLARLTREARTLALLNHPNIAQIHGVEETESARALVMEFVPGADLAARLRQGPLPLDEAVAIARQIADALEAAHEQGIIHRDLKPANIKLRDDGTVKVLDFGLAKALDATISSSDASGSVATITSPAMTQMGVILGTAAYMAPEQAKGKAVDKRADVWAFGVVLFEMLTGRPLFHGDSVAETMGFVATRDPDWTTLPAATPFAVRRLLARCLSRDPRQRLRDIGEARIALTHPDGDVDPSLTAPATRLRVRAIAASAALTALALAAGWFLGSRRVNTPVASVVPFHSEIVPTPVGAFGRHSTGRIFTFTPDGRTLIYASTDPAAQRLYRRDRDSDVAVPIAGTEGAYAPFVSPDGAAIGFFADGQMKKVPLAGGTTQTIRDFRSLSAPDRVGVGWRAELGPSQEIGYGAAWLGDDTIVYGRFTGGLWRVSSDAGTPTPLTTLTENGEIAHRQPHALPGGRAILCTVVRDLINRQGSTIEAVDLATGARTRIVDDATDGRFVPAGYLLFARSGALYSVRFDPVRLTVSGDPVRISDNVMHAVGGGSPARASGVAQFDLSADGILALLGGGMLPSPARVLIWVSSGGRTEPLPAPVGGILGPSLSPDGARLVVRLGNDVVTIGVKDGIATPLIKSALFPVWHPDGSRIFAALREQNRQNIVSVPLGGGAHEPVASSAHVLWPSSVSRDGRALFYVESNPKTGNDIWQVGLSPKTAPVAILATPANESYPMISPDGKWLAYVVGDGTSSEIYVRAYPGPGLVERISRDGGIAPVWSNDGRDIFYGRVQTGASTLQDIVRVPIDTSAGRIRLGSPVTFATGPFNFSTPVSSFDVTKDGTRILATRDRDERASAVGSAGTTIRLIANPNLTARRGS